MKYIIIIAILTLLWGYTLIKFQQATSVVGYTLPQGECYSDGTSDSISYPIYRAQEAK